MESASTALRAGLTAEVQHKFTDANFPDLISYGRLSLYAGWLIEGTADEKKFARKELQRLITKGRRIEKIKETLKNSHEEQAP